jgi:transposase-like protein
MGRPDKLTPQVQERIIQAVRGGNYVEVAARYAGIDKAQFYRWLERGEREKAGKFRDFRNAIKDAEAAAEAEAVAQVRLAARDSWQAGMTWLERKFPERWGRNDRLNITHKDRDVRTLTDAELEALVSLESKG